MDVTCVRRIYFWNYYHIFLGKWVDNIIFELISPCTWISPVGELHVSDPIRYSQLHFPPRLVVPTASNRAGVAHCVSINSFAGYVWTICAALAGWSVKGYIYLCWYTKTKQTKTNELCFYTWHPKLHYCESIQNLHLKCKWAKNNKEHRKRLWHKANKSTILWHYIDVTMTMVASQITSLMVVYLIIYSAADQRKHQSSASLAFVRGIHRDWWIPRTQGQ